jgi:hypothetical protein
MLDPATAMAVSFPVADHFLAKQRARPLGVLNHRIDDADGAAIRPYHLERSYDPVSSRSLSLISTPRKLFSSVVSFICSNVLSFVSRTANHTKGREIAAAIA